MSLLSSGAPMRIVLQPRRAATALCIVAAFSVPDVASAAPSAADAAAAQAAFDRGKQLAAAGNYAEACPKFEESQKTDPATGTLFHLADCWERIGRTASAWASFLDVASAAKAAGRVDREAIARSRAAALEPRLSRLTLVVAAKETSGIQIKRDGEVVGSGMWETAIPVDLGTHIVTATAPGKVPWQSKVEVKAEGASVVLTVPALVDAAAGEAKVAGGASDSGAGTSSVPPTGEAGGAFWSQKTIGIGLGTLGVLGIGASVALGLAAKSKFDHAKTQCAGGCDASGAAANEDAISLGNTATIVFGVAAAVAVGGGVLWLTAPRSSAAKQQGAGTYRIGVTTTGTTLVVAGVFE